MTIHEFTLKPLLRALILQDDDLLGREVNAARERALRAAIGSIDHDQSSPAHAFRQELTFHFAPDEPG